MHGAWNVVALQMKTYVCYIAGVRLRWTDNTQRLWCNVSILEYELGNVGLCGIVRGLTCYTPSWNVLIADLDLWNITMSRYAAHSGQGGDREGQNIGRKHGETETL